MAVSITKVPVNLDLGSDEIGMAFAHLHLPITVNAPFRILESARNSVATAWQNSLSAALDPIGGLPNSQIIVFPEFGLPYDVVPKVEETLKSAACPPNTIIITGTEWLDNEQYTKLLDTSDTPPIIKSKHPDEGLFVNPAIIWTKTRENALLRYIQPKLRPNPQEAASQLMYRGDDVLMFVSNKPDVVSFAVLICFDCIAMQGEKQMFEQLRDAAPETADNSSINWNLLFVPQYNEEPEHGEFLGFAESFLNRGGSIYNTADSAVAFINAPAARHGRTVSGFGRSSIFYRAGRWQSIGAKGPLDRVPGTYAIETLNPGLMRARFREDGPSVHRFSFLKPWETVKNSGSSRLPLINARSKKVSPIGDLAEWQNVSALTKVFGDWLRDDLASCDTAFIGKTSIEDEYSHIREQLFWSDARTDERLGRIVDLLLLGFPAPCRRPEINPDHWQQLAEKWHDDDHGQAIVHFAVVSSLLQLLDSVSFSGPSPLCSGSCGTMYFVVIDGWNHCKHDMLVQKYLEWIAKKPIGDIVGKNVVLILTRTTTMYLETANSTAQLITPTTDVGSRRDEAILREINPDLVNSPNDITSDGTRIYKHFSAILAHALERNSKDTAAQFLRERLSDAI